MDRGKGECGEFYCAYCNCFREKEPCGYCFHRNLSCFGTCLCCRKFREEIAGDAAQIAAKAASLAVEETSGTTSSAVQSSVPALMSRIIPQGTSFEVPRPLNRSTNIPPTSSSGCTSKSLSHFSNNRTRSSRPNVIHLWREVRLDAQKPTTSGSDPSRNRGLYRENVCLVFAAPFSHYVNGQMYRLFMEDDRCRLQEIPAYVYIYEIRTIFAIMTGICFYVNWCLNCKGLRNWRSCGFCRDDPKSCKMVCSCNNPKYRTLMEIVKVRADDFAGLATISLCGAKLLEPSPVAVRDAYQSPILPSMTELEPLIAACQSCGGMRLAPRLWEDILTLRCILCHHEKKLPVIRTLEPTSPESLPTPRSNTVSSEQSTDVHRSQQNVFPDQVRYGEPSTSASLPPQISGASISGDGCNQCQHLSPAPSSDGQRKGFMCCECGRVVIIPSIQEIQGRRQAHMPPQRNPAVFPDAVSYSSLYLPELPLLPSEQVQSLFEELASGQQQSFRKEVPSGEKQSFRKEVPSGEQQSSIPRVPSGEQQPSIPWELNSRLCRECLVESNSRLCRECLVDSNSRLFH